MNDQEFNDWWVNSKNAAFFAASCDAKPELTELLEKVFGIVMMTAGSGADNANANKECFQQLVPMLLASVDFAYGSAVNYKNQCGLTLGLLQRSSLENYLNFRYIVESVDPLKFADQYMRFTNAEILRIKQKAGEASIVSPKDHAILENAKTWLNKSGKIKGSLHWLGTGQNIYTIAESLETAGRLPDDKGLLAYVRNVYWITSNVTHASPITAHSFKRTDKHIFPIASERHARLMAIGAAKCAMGVASSASDFFEIKQSPESFKILIKELDAYLS